MESRTSTRLPSGKSRDSRENLEQLAAMAGGPQIDSNTSLSKGKLSFHCPACARLIWIRSKDAGLTVLCEGCGSDVVCPSEGSPERLLEPAAPGKAAGRTKLPSHRSKDHLPVENLSSPDPESEKRSRTALPTGPNRPGRTLADKEAPPKATPRSQVKPIQKHRDIEISPSELKRYRANSRERKIQRATTPHEELVAGEKSSDSNPTGSAPTVLPPNKTSTEGAPLPGASVGAAGHRLNESRVPTFAVREDIDPNTGEPLDSWGGVAPQPNHGMRRLLLLSVVVGVPALAAALFFMSRNQSNPDTTPVDPNDTTAHSIDETNAAQSILLEFLAARNIEEQLAFVRHPEETRPRMEAYKEQGHSRLPQVSGFGWSEAGWLSGTRFLWMDVEFNDGSSRTAVFEATDGKLKLDWESFVFFGNPDVATFFSKQPTEPGVYRVMCSIGDYYNNLYKDPYKYLCFNLVGADEISTCWAYTEGNSPVHRKLAELFKENRRRAAESIDRSADGGTIKIMLKIHFVKDENGLSHSQAWIDEVVSDSWLIP